MVQSEPGSREEDENRGMVRPAMRSTAAQLFGMTEQQAPNLGKEVRRNWPMKKWR